MFDITLEICSICLYYVIVPNLGYRKIAKKNNHFTNLSG